MAKKIPKPVDAFVGARIRARRLELSISQEKLAEAIGLTFQQVQKYEKGMNRVSSSRLMQIANTLNVPPPYFFEGAPSASRKADTKSVSLDFVKDFIASKDGLALVRAFLKIPKGLRRSIVNLVDKITEHE
jgi:transcriptional regulator with XRE-family HTH domain